MPQRLADGAVCRVAGERLRHRLLGTLLGHLAEHARGPLVRAGDGEHLLAAHRLLEDVGHRLDRVSAHAGVSGQLGRGLYGGVARLLDECFRRGTDAAVSSARIFSARRRPTWDRALTEPVSARVLAVAARAAAAMPPDVYNSAMNPGACLMMSPTVAPHVPCDCSFCSLR